MTSLLCEMDHGAHEARTAGNKRLPKAKLAIFLARLRLARRGLGVAVNRGAVETTG
jgi:hypothetical protein